MAGQLSPRVHVDLFTKIENVFSLLTEGEKIPGDFCELAIPPFSFLNHAGLDAIYIDCFIQDCDLERFPAPF